MRRKKSEVPTRIWAFGLTDCVMSNEHLVRDQLRRSHRYYNDLIEIEKCRRGEYRDARSQLPAIEPVEAAHKEVKAELEDVRARIKMARKIARKRIAQPELAAQAKALKVRVAKAHAEVKALRELLKTDPWLQAESERINKEANAKIRAFRGAPDAPYSGCYLLVEKAIEPACGKKGEDPEFKPWRDRGRVGVQIEGVVTTEDVFRGKSRFLQIDPLPADSWDTRAKCRQAKTKARIRIGSEGRDPIWTEFEVAIHRKLPPGQIKWAWVLIRSVGGRRRYELQLTIESNTFHAGPCGQGIVAIDLGWRLGDEGERVAYAVDDRGVEQDIRVTNEFREGLALCDRLRSYQDRWMNEAVNALKANRAMLPDWFAQQARYASNWRSPRRLVALTTRWKEESGRAEELKALWQKWKAGRLAAGLDLFGQYAPVASWAVRRDFPELLLYLEWWRKKSKHLYEWRERSRFRLLGWRKSFYEKTALDLAEKYKTIIVEKFDLRAFTRNAKPEEDASKDVQHRQRNDVAPSEFRNCLISTAGKAKVKWEPMMDTTRQCADCGFVNTWPENERRKLMLRCAGCGREWDQDRNAARVLLKRYLGILPGPGRPAPPRERLGDEPEPEASRNGMNCTGSGTSLTSVDAGV